MQFNDTTNKDGIIQKIEFLTNLGDGGITSNATLLKVMTGQVNEAFDRIMPRLLNFTKSVGWDDINHSDTPSKKENIVSGTNKHTLSVDGNSLDILNITALRILTSATATEYTDLERLTADDDRALDALSPNPSVSGVPTHALIQGNDVYLYPTPNYSATNGLQSFYERQQSYFVDSDTTKEPGIPLPFHRLLPLYTALQWLLVNKGNNTMLISRVEADILKTENQLDAVIAQRNPQKNKLTPNIEDNR